MSFANEQHHIQYHRLLRSSGVKFTKDSSDTSTVAAESDPAADEKHE